MEDYDEASDEGWGIKVTSAFPVDLKLKDASGLPWGCVLRPFAAAEGGASIPLVDGAAVDRCAGCFGYPSYLCTFEYRKWKCALCGHRNRTPARYNRAGDRNRVPELSGAVYELEMSPSKDDELAFGESQAFIAIVDTSGDSDFMELVRNGLGAAVSALSAGDFFGIVTVGQDVGLYDMRGEVPSVRHIAIPTSGELPIGLDEVLPLDELLVPVNEYAEMIKLAIDSLLSAEELGALAQDEEAAARRRASGLSPRSAAAADSAASMPADSLGEGGLGECPPPMPAGRRKVGYGACIGGLLDMLQTVERSAYSVRLLSFLAGPPNFGLGALRTTEPSPSREGPAAEFATVCDFYERTGGICAERGVCVDIFLISHRYADLASLRHLPILSGGSLILYEPVGKEGWAALPVDVHRQLARPRAMQGMLRLRTSAEFRPSQGFGHLSADTEYENLYHIPAVDETSCFSFDFEFAGSDCTFEDENGHVAAPVLQLAFCYCMRVPGRHGLVKRLRVETRKAEIAQSLKQLYNAVDPRVVLKLLTHKICLACEDEGVVEGAGILRGWLLRFLQSYKSWEASEPGGIQSPSTSSVLGLPSGSALATIPRYVFGMLKSPLLREQDSTPDWRAYVMAMWSRLEPAELGRAVYPELSAYTDPATPEPDRSRLPLAVQTLTDHGGHFAGGAVTSTGEAPCAYFVLDAFSALVVYTPIHTDYPMPDGASWPPARESALRLHVRSMKDRRLVTPRVVYARPPSGDTRWFTSQLLDDAGVVSAGSWAEFVEQLQGS